jgi:hypothetical protein
VDGADANNINFSVVLLDHDEPSLGFAVWNLEGGAKDQELAVLLADVKKVFCGEHDVVLKPPVWTIGGGYVRLLTGDYTVS